MTYKTYRKPTNSKGFLYKSQKSVTWYNIANLFRDYPHKLTAEQKEIFDKANPYWADFMQDREKQGVD